MKSALEAGKHKDKNLILVWEVWVWGYNFSAKLKRLFSSN